VVRAYNGWEDGLLRALLRKVQRNSLKLAKTHTPTLHGPW
jgi:hypothetical protein